MGTGCRNGNCYDWLEDPSQCINQLIKFAPVFESVASWIVNVRMVKSPKEHVAIDLVWSNNEYNIAESHIQTFEELYRAVRWSLYI